MQKKNHERHEPALHTGQHPKQDFQVERIAFFSDAIYAIAITLLIIEFKIPEVTKDSTYADVWQQVVGLKYKFFALVFSFVLIVNYWMRHHLLFKHIHNYNRQIIVANMMGLLPIIFFPFTTAFLYENLEVNQHIMIIPIRLFLLNNITAGGTAYFLYWTVMKRFGGMSYPMEKQDIKEFQSKLLLMTLGFSLIFVLSFLVPLEYAFIGILPVAFINFRERFFKKAVK